jgi:hypothetical protein
MQPGTAVIFGNGKQKNARRVERQTAGGGGGQVARPFPPATAAGTQLESPRRPLLGMAKTAQTLAAVRCMRRHCMPSGARGQAKGTGSYCGAREATLPARACSRRRQACALHQLVAPRGTCGCTHTRAADLQDVQARDLRRSLRPRKEKNNSPANVTAFQRLTCFTSSSCDRAPDMRRTL